MSNLDIEEYVMRSFAGMYVSVERASTYLLCRNYKEPSPNREGSPQTGH